MQKLILSALAAVLLAGAAPAHASGGYAPAAPILNAVQSDLLLQVTYGQRMSLGRVINRLAKRGYWGVKNVRWLPYAYVVTAKGYRGKLVRITVNAYNGNIIRIDRIGGPGGGYGGGYGGGNGGGYGGGNGGGYGGGYGGGNGGGYGGGYGLR